jgi:hypothetical protein
LPRRNTREHYHAYQVGQFFPSLRVFDRDRGDSGPRGGPELQLAPACEASVVSGRGNCVDHLGLRGVGEHRPNAPHLRAAVPATTRRNIRGLLGTVCYLDPVRRYVTTSERRDLGGSKTPIVWTRWSGKPGARHARKQGKQTTTVHGRSSANPVRFESKKSRRCAKKLGKGGSSQM